MWIRVALFQMIALCLLGRRGVALASPAAPGLATSAKSEGVPPSPKLPPVEITIRREAKPFWKRQPERLRQIREERAIQVSVRREDQKDGMMTFVLNGAGDVARSCGFSFALGQQFERLSDVNDHFEQVVSDPIRQQMLMLAQAMHVHAHMLFQTQIVKGNQGAGDELRFEVIWGHFKGMKGVVGFEPLDLGKCEVSIYARYATRNPPVPKSFMGFALEVIVQHVAENMRGYIERQSADAPEHYQEQGVSHPELTLDRVMRSNDIPIELLRNAPSLIPEAGKNPRTAPGPSGGG